MSEGFRIYHSALRIALVVCAVTLVFDSGILSDSTQQLSQNTQQYLASAINMNASVKPTELNQYTAALTEKENELKARESALAEREIAVSLNSGGSASGDVSTYVLSSILFVLLVLIILNYFLDYLRSQRDQYSVAT